MKLNIGSGGLKIPGYTSVDKYHPGADVKRDAADTGFGFETIDYIFTSHMIEHLEPDHFDKTLEHWHQILKPTGHLEILCPNARIYIEEWLERHNSQDWDHLLVWGNRNLLGWSGKGQGMYNRNLFTTEILREKLTRKFFIVAECKEVVTRVKDRNHIEFRVNGDIRCLARKHVL